MEFVDSDLLARDLKYEGWKDYGFQNENPRTDFRGSGILGLKQLIYFTSKYNDVRIN